MQWRRIRQFKTLLEARQHTLHLSIEDQKQYTRRAEPEPDAVDQAATVFDKESFLQENTRERELLRMIDSALGRIRDGNFGKYLSWGKEIDRRRLQAVPWTRYCIHCQERFERRLYN